MRRLATAATVIVAAGCGGDDDSERNPSSPTADTGTIATEAQPQGDPQASGPGKRPPPNPAVVRCGSCSRTSAERARVLDLDAPSNVRLGPLVLYSARQFARSPSSEFAPARLQGRLLSAPSTLRRAIRAGSVYHAQKLLVLIEGSHAVTLAIPPAQRGHASLLYAARPTYSGAAKELGVARLSDGRAAVRFEPYRRGHGPISEVPGGFVVAGARCLPLDVWVEGTEGAIRGAIPFGMHDSC